MDESVVDSSSCLRSGPDVRVNVRRQLYRPRCDRQRRDQPGELRYSASCDRAWSRVCAKAGYFPGGVSAYRYQPSSNQYGSGYGGANSSACGSSWGASRFRLAVAADCLSWTQGWFHARIARTETSQRAGERCWDKARPSAIPRKGVDGMRFNRESSVRSRRRAMWALFALVSVGASCGYPAADDEADTPPAQQAAARPPRRWTPRRLS
jgi:hypothetical protein